MNVSTKELAEIIQDQQATARRHLVEQKLNGAPDPHYEGYVEALDWVLVVLNIMEGMRT